MEHSDQISAFFDAYATRVNRALAGQKVNPKEVSASFADFFVESSPQGVIGGKNGWMFRRTIPKGFARYRKMGITAMLIQAKDIKPLDDGHAMVTVRWQSVYNRKDGTPASIVFSVTYFLTMVQDSFKIFAYITGDEERVLKEHGLIS
jgi:hypothetical protein